MSCGNDAVAKALTAGLRASGSLPSLAGDIKPDDVIITLSISLKGFNSASFSVSILPPLVPLGETFPLKLFSPPVSALTPFAPSVRLLIPPVSSSSYNVCKVRYLGSFRRGSMAGIGD
jgi:hypothetical protein